MHLPNMQNMQIEIAVKKYHYLREIGYEYLPICCSKIGFEVTDKATGHFFVTLVCLKWINNWVINFAFGELIPNETGSNRGVQDKP